MGVDDAHSPSIQDQLLNDAFQKKTLAKPGAADHLHVGSELVWREGDGRTSARRCTEANAAWSNRLSKPHPVLWINRLFPCWNSGCSSHLRDRMVALVLKNLEVFLFSPPGREFLLIEFVDSLDAFSDLCSGQ